MYLNADDIVASKQTHRPFKGRTVTGYGRNIPTYMLVKLKNNHWYRVKAMVYGNNSTLYIRGNKSIGEQLLDYDSIDRMTSLVSAE